MHAYEFGAVPKNSGGYFIIPVYHDYDLHAGGLQAYHYALSFATVWASWTTEKAMVNYSTYKM